MGTVIGEAGKGDLLAPYGSRVQLRTRFDLALASVKMDVFVSEIDYQALSEEIASGTSESSVTAEIPSDALSGKPAETFPMRQEGEQWVVDLTLRSSGYYRLTAVEKDFGKEVNLSRTAWRFSQMKFP